MRSRLDEPSSTLLPAPALGGGGGYEAKTHGQLAADSDSSISRTEIDGVVSLEWVWPLSGLCGLSGGVWFGLPVGSIKLSWSRGDIRPVRSATAQVSSSASGPSSGRGPKQAKSFAMWRWSLTGGTLQ